MISAPAAAPAPRPDRALVTLRQGASPAALGTGASRLVAGSRTWIVRLRGARTLAALRADPAVATAEPDRQRTRLAEGDPLLARQPYLQQIRWTPAAGVRRPLVAVLDTGVDGSVPDLRGQIAPGARSFVDDAPLVDRSGHGTHVAGLIAAATRNGIGIAGVANARILVVKVADAQWRATTSTLVRGIRYAVSRHAKIINVSFGGSGFSRLEQDAILDARRAGALVIAAAGNSGRAGSPIEYPGAYRHVLAVGAVRPDGGPIIDSTRGPQVAIAAPGKRILSTARHGRFERRTGTSMATAIVSGAAARLLAQRPGIDASQVRALLLSTARDVGPAGRDDATGWGVLDLAAALAAPTPGRDSPEPNDDPALARSTPEPLPGSAPGAATLRGTIEEWADPKDDYRVALEQGDTLELTAQAAPGSDVDLLIWRPGAPAFRAGGDYTRRWLAAASLGPGETETLTFVAAQTGVHTVEVKAAAGRGRYRLAIVRKAPPPPPPAP
jgi:subtilisin family serine protease